MESPGGAARRFRRSAEAALMAQRDEDAARRLSKAVRHLAVPAPRLILNPISGKANKASHGGSSGGDRRPSAAHRRHMRRGGSLEFSEPLADISIGLMWFTNGCLRAAMRLQLQ